MVRCRRPARRDPRRRGQETPRSRPAHHRPRGRPAPRPGPRRHQAPCANRPSAVAAPISAAGVPPDPSSSHDPTGPFSTASGAMPRAAAIRAIASAPQRLPWQSPNPTPQRRLRASVVVTGVGVDSAAATSAVADRSADAYDRAALRAELRRRRRGPGTRPPHRPAPRSRGDFDGRLGDPRRGADPGRADAGDKRQPVACGRRADHVVARARDRADTGEGPDRHHLIDGGHECPTALEDALDGPRPSSTDRPCRVPSTAVGPRRTPPKTIGVTSMPLPSGPGIGSTIRSTSPVRSLTRNSPLRGVIVKLVSPASAATSSARKPAQSNACAARTVSPSASVTVTPSASTDRPTTRARVRTRLPSPIAASA